MTMDADQIIDRRRLRRKVTFWRVVAFLAAAIIIVGGLVAIGGSNIFPGLAGPQIARISITGFISENQDQLDLLDQIGKDPSVKGVLVSIDSTGGATAGGEALYEGLLKLAQRKPTVAAIGTVGASAAYMAAIATDHIVVRRSSITGSIGVIFEFPQVSELLKTLGIEVEEVKSAPLKAEPSPFKPFSPEARDVMAGIVNDTFNWFVDIVAKRRNLARPDALALADGRIFTGSQALAARLVDEIGGEETAINWLVAEKGVAKDLPIRDWRPRNRTGGIFPFSDAVALWLAHETGIAPEMVRGVLGDVLPDRLKLDGLMSVWQGPSGGRDDGPAEGATR